MMEKVLIFAGNGFEDKELYYPYFRFQEAGYKVIVVAPKAKEIYNGEHGLTITSDLSPEDVNLDDYVAVIIPGGRAPDRLRTDAGIVKLVKDAVQKRKVVAAICHGAQLLIEADVVKGKKMTCYKSVATDLKNAGGIYQDSPVVVDDKFVTSRFPSDLPDFCRETLKLLAKKK
jgi:protease I